MSQLMCITMTFKRDNFSLQDYLFNTQDEDRINIITFYKCWSLAAQIEEVARKYELQHENSIYAAGNIDFLKEVYFILKEEYDLVKSGLKKEVYSPWETEDYCTFIEDNIKNLEWFLFYLTGRIAVSQLFQKLSEKCYSLTAGRTDWIAMCRAWGNTYPDNFETLFWIM